MAIRGLAAAESVPQYAAELQLRMHGVLSRRSQQISMWMQTRCPTRHRPFGVMQLPDDKSLLARKSRKENAVSRLGETLFFGGGTQESRKASQGERLMAPRIFARGELAKTPDENSSYRFLKQLQIF